MSEEKKLVITHYTDPLCFWCYAMEPEMRKVRVLLDDQLDYRIVMGVLSSDVREIIGYGPDSEQRLMAYRNMLANYFDNAMKLVKMPLSVDNMHSWGADDFVSLPLSQAYCAMRIIDEHIAEAYLRRMRECVFSEGRSLSSTDAQVELASEFPVDTEQFRASLESDEAAQLLQSSVAECQRLGIHSFPTLVFQYEDRRGMVQGYQTIEELRHAIAQVTGGEITLSEAEYSPQAAERFVDRFGKVAAHEVKTMFSLDDNMLAEVMMDLVSTKRYKTQSCGTSYFVMRV